MQRPQGHVWRFFRSGGFDQVRLDTGADLVHLPELDQKLWVALSCPTRGIEFDPRTLDLMDRDGDGRIRAPELLEAVRWACSMVKDPEALVRGGRALPLSLINEAQPEGKLLLESARQILRDLGKPDATEISVEDTTDTVRVFAQTLLNGDGVVPAEAASDPATRQALTDILSTLGPVEDRSGKPGVDQARVEQFFLQARAVLDWHDRSLAERDLVMPLGDATPAGFTALEAVRAKVEDYFARCRLAAFDPRAMNALNRHENDYLSLAAKDLTITTDEIGRFPLARVEANRPLPLTDGLNPAWAAALGAMRDLVVAPLLGERVQLTAEEWAAIDRRFDVHRVWQASRPATPVAKLGPDRLRELFAGEARSALEALIHEDKALAPHFGAIGEVDRLARYHRDLHKLLCNFVNFRDFYSRKAKAVFQAGTLYLDQRSCDLCVRVADAGKHGELAHLARTYLAYCDCARKGSTEKVTIAAAFTAGDSDNLMVGRNGVFYDRLGRDWDATITKITDHPISVRQAFWSPYKRAIRWVEEQVAKRAAAADAAATDKLTGAAGKLGEAATAGAPPAKPKFDVGVVAALGVAVGGITAALGGILEAFFGLGIWMPLGVLALTLLISGPSMVIAWLKLRQRNLGPILDANGWAVNSRAKISIPFGASLTGTATLPAGAKRDLFDPYAPKTSLKTYILRFLAFVFFLLLLAGAAWNFGVIHAIHPETRLPKSRWMIKQEQAREAEKKKAEEEAKKAANPAPAPAPAAPPAPAAKP